MNRTERLYALAEELRAAGPDGRTGAWLAQRFEVTTRTIKRDISALQQSGAPIWASGGPGGGYVLDRSATLPPLTFTPGEAVAVALALATQTDVPFAPEGQQAMNKVLAAMPPPQQDEAGALAGRVWIRTGDRPAGRNPAARLVDEALRTQTVVILDYVNAQGESSARRAVEPLAYALNRDRWYLLAWCRRRRGGRWFRLDRIQRATRTAEPFAPRDMRAVFGEPPADITSIVLR